MGILPFPILRSSLKHLRCSHFFPPYGGFLVKVVFLLRLLFPVDGESRNLGCIYEWGIGNRPVKPV